MEKDSSNTASSIPEELKLQLTQFQRQLWIRKVTEALIAGILGLALSFIIIFLIERLVEIPLWLRIINLIIGISIFAIFVPMWLNKWLFKHRKENQIATLIAKKFPHLGDEILGVIELDAASAKYSSKDLRAAAMLTVAKNSAQRDFTLALPTSYLIKLSTTLIICIILILSFLFIIPQSGFFSTVKRWILPWSNTERFTYTKLDVEAYKNGLIVPKGEPFNLDISLHPESRLEESISIKFEDEAWKKTQFKEKKATFSFEGKTKNGIIDIKSGDTFEQIQLEPQARPKLKSTIAKIQLPSYLGNKEIQHLNLSAGTLRPLVGSLTTITGETSKPLSSSSASNIFRLATDEEQIVGDQETFINTEEQVETHHTGNQIITKPFVVGDSILKFELNWTDSVGLESKKPSVIRIEPELDQVPSLAIESKEIEIIQLLDHPIHFNINASDDYGIAKFGITWDGRDFDNNNEIRKGELTYFDHEAAKHTKNTISHNIVFDPSKNQITSPQKVVFKSWGLDQFPNRKKQYSSSKLIVHFYDKSMMTAHNNNLLNNIKERTENLLSKSIENIEILENIKKLEQLEREKLANGDDSAKKRLDKLKQQIENLQSSEENLKRELDKLTENSQELFQQAAEDQTLPPEVLKDLNEMTDDLKNAKSNKQQANKSAQNSKEKIEQQKNAKKDLKQMHDELSGAKESLDKAITKAKSAKDKGEVESFLNRIVSLSKKQKEIHKKIITLQNKNINKNINLQLVGEHFDSLTNYQKQTLHPLYLEQQRIKKSLEWLYEDLNEYGMRTQKKEVLNVVKVMTKTPTRTHTKETPNTTNFIDGMNALIQFFESSHWLAAIEDSDYWSDTIQSWANILNNTKQNSSSGNGGGGNGSQASKLNDQDFNFMLRVLEMVKAEQIVREKTRALEIQKRLLTPSNSDEN